MLEPNTAPSVSAGERPVFLRLVASLDQAPSFGVTAGLRLREGVDQLDAAAHRWLVAYSVVLLRISLGAVFLGFGLLKLVPGESPAANLVEATTNLLTFGLVPGPSALVAVGVLECVIGICLISGLALRGAIYLLGIQLVGILSPVVLLAPRLFSGPHNAPTLEGQYVLKDIILVGATLVVAATLRGGRLSSPETAADAERTSELDHA
ncbi:MAG: DoxX family protein [Solirubrobacteraceae bacterium]